MKKADKGAIAAAWLTQPAVIYTVIGLVILGTVYFIFPDLYNKGKEAGKKVFDDLRDGVTGIFDSARSNLSSIVGAPKSQEPAKRETGDAVRGLLKEDDRALSDLYDRTFGVIFPN